MTQEKKKRHYWKDMGECTELRGGGRGPELENEQELGVWVAKDTGKVPHDQPVRTAGPIPLPV